MSIWRCSDFASYRRRGHFSHAGCEAYRLRSRPLLVSISPTAAYTRKKQIKICGCALKAYWRRSSRFSVPSKTHSRPFCSVCKEATADVIGDVGRCDIMLAAPLCTSNICVHLDGRGCFWRSFLGKKKSMTLLFTKSLFSLREKCWTHWLKERSLDLVERLS